MDGLEDWNETVHEKSDELIAMAHAVRNGQRRRDYDSNGLGIRDYWRPYGVGSATQMVWMKALRMIATNPQEADGKAKDLRKLRSFLDSVVDVINYAAFAGAEALCRMGEVEMETLVEELNGTYGVTAKREDDELAFHLGEMGKENFVNAIGEVRGRNEAVDGAVGRTYDDGGKPETEWEYVDFGSDGLVEAYVDGVGGLRQHTKLKRTGELPRRLLGTRWGSGVTSNSQLDAGVWEVMAARKRRGGVKVQVQVRTGCATLAPWLNEEEMKEAFACRPDDPWEVKGLGKISVGDLLRQKIDDVGTPNVRGRVGVLWRVSKMGLRDAQQLTVVSGVGGASIMMNALKLAETFEKV